MKPSINSKAEIAYRKGIEAAKAGKSKNENPFRTGRVIHLSNWWEKGFNEGLTN